MEIKNNEKILAIPKRLLAPIKNFLEQEIVKWKRREKSIKSNDPFMDEDRGNRNSKEDDVDEQVGHFEAEIKIGFVKRQLIQLRKALTRIKLGKYGVCEKCGNMIDTDRLSIEPETTICVKCMKERE